MLVFLFLVLAIHSPAVTSKGKGLQCGRFMKKHTGDFVKVGRTYFLHQKEFAESPLEVHRRDHLNQPNIGLTSGRTAQSEENDPTLPSRKNSVAVFI